jgi:hypothetical protein
MIGTIANAGEHPRNKDSAFILACLIVYVVAVLAVPSYTPLIEADSNAYLEFNPARNTLYPVFLSICTRLGLSLVQITWVQVIIFALALGFLLKSLLRIKIPKLLLALFVAALVGNFLFSSLQRSIMSEALYFPLTMVTVALWIDHFRTGKIAFLGWAGLAVGFAIGVRPIGIALIPMHAIAGWMTWSRKTVTGAIFLLALIVPLGIGPSLEYIVSRAVNGDARNPHLQYLLMGKAAILIKPDTVYVGPHASALNDLGEKLKSIFLPAQRYLIEAPSLPVRTYLTAYYEATAQEAVLRDELSQAARREGVSVEELRKDLGIQTIKQNLSGYAGLVLLNELGQWSVALKNFPANAQALAGYAAGTPGIDLGGRIPATVFQAGPTMLGLIAYPVFLIAGAVTLVLSAGLLVFLVRPELAAGYNGFYWMLACYLSTMCHAYTLCISLVNVWTPRFLMAVFPQLAIIALCLLMLALRRHAGEDAHAKCA